MVLQYSKSEKVMFSFQRNPNVFALATLIFTLFHQLLALLFRRTDSILSYQCLGEALKLPERMPRSH